MHTAGITVNVVDLETQLLHHLKVVVDDKCLRKLGVETVHDPLCPANLTDTRSKVKTFYFNEMYSHIVWIAQRFKSFLSNYLTPVWPCAVHAEHTHGIGLGKRVHVKQVVAGDANGNFGHAVGGPRPLVSEVCHPGPIRQTL